MGLFSIDFEKLYEDLVLKEEQILGMFVFNIQYIVFIQLF